MFSWARLFGSEKKPLMGLEISSGAVKLLSIRRTNQVYTVEQFGIEFLLPGVVVENTIKDIESLSNALKRLVGNITLETDWVATSVSGSNVITNVIQVNKNLSDQEILDEIEIDAPRYISFPFEEVSLDIERLGVSSEDPEKIDVLLAISRTENVEARQEALALAGLEAKIVEVDAFALERAFPFCANQLPNCGIGQTVAVLDLGATSMTLNVFVDFKRVYTREHRFGGQSLTNEIQRRYGLSFEEAEKAKRGGQISSDGMLEIFESFQSTIIQQIGHACKFYFSANEASEMSSEIDYMVLTGGSSWLPRLDILVQERLEHKTFKVDLFQEMQFKNKALATALAPHAANLMVCVGLALRNCDSGTD